MAMNVKETKELVELARSKKLFLMEAIWTRFEIQKLLFVSIHVKVNAKSIT
jgi:predicted dehydrogenase